MTQTPAGDWPIDPNTTDGVTLADKLNRLVEAAHSTHYGLSRPPDLTKGGLYCKQGPSGEITLMLWNGINEIPIANFNDNVMVSLNNVYMALEIQALLAPIRAAISAQENVPAGVIVMWSGAIASIPTGWRLCDGGGGTPNLTDRFIVGAGWSYAVNATGGQDVITQVPWHDHSVALTTSGAGGHAHAITVQSGGSHKHTFGGGTSSRVINGDSAPLSNAASGASPQSVYNARATMDNGGEHAHNASSDIEPNHTHTVNGRTAATGLAWGLDIRPKYYALAYIMKL